MFDFYEHDTSRDDLDDAVRASHSWEFDAPG